jgi:hypothetical protein
MTCTTAAHRVHKVLTFDHDKALSSLICLVRDAHQDCQFVRGSIDRQRAASPRRQMHIVESNDRIVQLMVNPR